jgi:hypothetical protein
LSASALLSALEAKLGDSSPGSGLENAEHNFECPKCSTGKKKLGINLAKKVFHCFRCHWSGHLGVLLKEVGIDLESVREFISTGPVVAAADTAEAKPLPTIPGFKRIYGYRRQRGEVETDLIKYCEKRGQMTSDDVEDLHMGISSDPALVGRLIIPIREHDDVVNYLARSVYPWLGPKEISGPLWEGWKPRSEIFFGYNQLKMESNVVLVEGFWDWWALRRTSKSWVPVATLGAHLSPVVLGRILQKKPRRITVFLDGDDAGEEGTFQMVTALLKRRVREVYVARPPKGKDPDDLDEDKLMVAINTATPAGLWLMER